MHLKTGYHPSVKAKFKEICAFLASNLNGYGSYFYFWLIDKNL